MRIDEAIRINTVLKKAPVLKDDPQIIEAFNLSIEALKAVKDSRVKWGVRGVPQLPEETE